MKNLYFVSLLLLLFACSKSEKEVTRTNAFISPQLFFVADTGSIDSIISDISLDSEKLLKKGIKKRKVTTKPDPLKGVYTGKYVVYMIGELISVPMYVYTNDTLIINSNVLIHLQKYAESSQVNCVVNNKKCWCSY